MKRNNKIELLAALVNKSIMVNITINGCISHNCYVYLTDSNSCVVTKTYISEFVKPVNYDDRFKRFEYTDITAINVVA